MGDEILPSLKRFKTQLHPSKQPVPWNVNSAFFRGSMVAHINSQINCSAKHILWIYSPSKLARGKGQGLAIVDLSTKNFT